MKRFLTILILIALTGTLAACATPVEAPSPAVHDDPIGEYEAMAAESRFAEIGSLVTDLVSVGDYINAGEIISAEYRALRYPVDFISLASLFAGHEDAVALDAWTAGYLAFSKGHTSEWAQEIEMLSSYNAVIRQYYEDDWQAFKYVLENADRRFTDIDEKQLAQCGTASDGKILISFPYGNNGSWMLGASAALPAERIPKSLEEVEYVIFIEETHTPVGTYTSGATAERRDYTISMIHCPDGEVIFKSQPVLGGDPPRAINENQPGGVGDAPAPGSVATELVSALLRLDRTQTDYGLSAAEQALVGEYKISHIQHGAQAASPEEFGFRSGVTIVLNEDGTGSLGNSSIKWSIETEGHLQMTDESGHGYGLRYDDEYIYQTIVKDGESYTVVFPR